MAEWVRLVDGNWSDRPVGYCKSKRRYLTKKLMQVHKCNSKKCTGFEKINCEYWKQRARAKEAKKKRRLEYGNSISSEQRDKTQGQTGDKATKKE